MATNNHTTTFWHFLENYSIEIPIIQRDYAQGRIGKENLRKNFLNDLKEALDKSKEMKLDFVYGSTENGKLYPLDGQQRLTTLWLLHWYIALRAGKLKEASDYLKNFSYETRVSSRNFCEEMCKPENFKNYNLKNTVVEFIINQTWFYSAWKQDPTIQSMLRMLGGSKQNNNIDDGIEKVFDCSSCIQRGNFTEGLNRSENCPTFIKYYTILTSEKCPIVFYYLPKDFGNSDDLYVKMNARGEQLTSFENFKADLIGYIKKQAENDKNWDALLDSQEGFPIKMDTSWTDIFWKYKSKGTCDGRMTNHIDEIYFAFMNRFFWNELFIAKDLTTQKYILDIGEGDENSTKENDNISYKYLNDSDNKNDYDTKIAYKGLDVYEYDSGEIPISFFQKMKDVMNNLSAYLKMESIPVCPWNNNFNFIPTYEKDDFGNNFEIINNASDHILKVTILNQVQRIVFFAICKYFHHDNIVKDDKESLERWLRVVWNLVSGEDENGRPQIRSTQAMRTAMKFIGELNSHDVYNSLSNYEHELGNSDFDERCKEEIAKAKQILDINGKLHEYNGDKTWEKIIIETEKYAFFKGTIRFLFQNDKGEIDIDSSTKTWNTNNFITKWNNAQRYFDENQIIPTTDIAKYFDDDQIKTVFNKYSFNIKNWKTILIQDSIADSIHHFLIGTPPQNKGVLLADIINILNSIDTQSVWLLQDWQQCSIVLTNYSTKRSEPYKGYVFQVGNDIRNKWNNVISKNNEIEVRVPQACGGEKIERNGQVYYRGLWTDMMYKDHLFRYFGNNTVCLMTNEGACKILKNDKESDNPENTYYFEVTEDFFNNNDIVNTILNHLNRLIKHANTDKQTL